MGALYPIAGGIKEIGTALGTVNQAVSAAQFITGVNNPNDVALEQLQQRQRLQEKQIAQQNALERERLAAVSEADERDRKKALKRAVARQRANYGGSGLSSDGGSSEAVLLGLFDESEQELAEREELDNLRRSALNLDLSQTRSLNLLQATQLAERNNINRLF